MMLSIAALFVGKHEGEKAYTKKIDSKLLSLQAPSHSNLTKNAENE